MVFKLNVTSEDRAAARSFLCAHYNVYIIMIFLFSKPNNLKVFKK